ncbi:MAG TPA: acyl-CoA dehydrogenase family protein [Gammaproteobacteria bacterium]|nr:acyl-CoA dehydrogenase family protein [Gammaproteobacteria bacterium]
MTPPNLREYGFDADYQAVYDTAWRYAREHLYALAPRMDREDWFPEAEFRALAEAGLLGVTVPAEYGGAGMDVLAQCFICEAVSYWNHTVAASLLASDNLCLDNLVRNANEEQKARYLPRFCSGRAIGALGMTEPGAGSDALGSMATRATRDGEHYVLNGRKLFITNGPVADVLLVYAKTAPEKKQHGISAFIVEKSFPGFRVAQHLDKMGWRGSPTGELVFDELRVPAANRVGEENGGVGIMMSGLDVERVIAAFYGLGLAQRALDLAVDYATVRRQFDRPIGDFQMVQAMLADMYTDVATIRALTYQVGRELAKLPPGAAGRGAVHQRSAAAVLHAGRASMRVLDLAVQLHGGMGFMNESEVNRLYRSGKVLEIGAGTTQVRQLIIAAELLKEAAGR